MNENVRLNEMQEIELLDLNGGGGVSAVAGGIAGTMIGAFAGLIPAAATGDISYVKKGAVTGGTVGVWAGMGCPLP